MLVELLAATICVLTLMLIGVWVWVGYYIHKLLGENARLRMQHEELKHIVEKLCEEIDIMQY